MKFSAPDGARMVLLSQILFLLVLHFTRGDSAPNALFASAGTRCGMNRGAERLQPYVDYLAHPSAGRGTPAIRAQVQALLETYAPRIWFHPEERFGPMDPLEFIANSSLWFRSSYRDQQRIAKRGEVEPTELGLGQRGKYAKRTYFPSFKQRLMRSTRLGEAAYSLKYEGESYRGSSDAPMLWKLSEVQTEETCADESGRRTLLVEYWYHSAFNEATSVGIGDHQGDWEGFAMLIDVDAGVNAAGRVELTHRLRSTFLAAHEGGAWLCSADLHWIDRAESHPEVFSALGTHATYAREGLHDVLFLKDVTARGSAWETWKNLRPLVLEPYYGYSGAWGEESVLGFMTGPLVPGPGFKPQPKRGIFAGTVAECAISQRKLASVPAR